MNIIKKYLLVIAVFSILFSSTGAYALIKSPPEKAILPNGMRVVVVEDKSLPMAAVGLMFDTQVAAATNCNRGLGQIYQHLLRNSGFADQTRYGFNAELEKVGIMTEFAANSEVFYSACQGNADQLLTMLEAVKKLGFLLKPDPEDFATAKNEAIRFLKNSKRFPLSSGLMTRKMWKDIYPGLNYECHGPIKNNKLNRTQFKDLEAFAQEVFVPNNAVLVVVGDVNATDVFKESVKVFAEPKAAQLKKAKITRDDHARSRKKEAIEFYDIDNTNVLIGFEAPGLASTDMPAAGLWQALFDGINNSWLDMVVKKEFPDLTNLSASYLPGKDKGLFVIGFTSEDSDVNRPVNFILSSLANMHSNPPRGAKLSRLIDMQQLKDLEKSEMRLERVYDLGYAEIIDSFRIADGLVAAYSRVTPRDMKMVARQMFTQSRYAVRIGYPLAMQKAEKTPLQMKKLDNGLNLMVRNYSGSEIVGLSILFGIDSCSNNEKDKRMAAIVAEMIANYVNDRENRHLNMELDKIGASLNSVYVNDFLLINARTRKSNVEDLVKLLGNLIRNPEYSIPFFKKSKEKLISRLKNKENALAENLKQKVIEKLYPGLNIYSAVSDKDNIKSITFEEVQKFYKSWAVGRNMHVAAVGNFNEEKIMKELSLAFAGLPTGVVNAKSQCPPWVASPLSETSVETISLPELEDSAVILTALRMKPFLLINQKVGLREDFGANVAIGHVLFSSKNAMLVKELKKIGAYQGLEVKYLTNLTYSLFFFKVQVPYEKLEEVKKVIRKLLGMIPELKVSKENIVAAGLSLRSMLNRQLEKSDAQAAMLASYMYNGLNENFLNDILDVYSSLSVEDVKNAAANNFKNYYMLIGVPEDKK
ncbi:MAG: M16 family metallopeptidase [Candidatus Rifleibacteriota bacterium]